MNYLKITRFPALNYSCDEAMNTLCTNLSYCGSNIQKLMVTSRYAQEGKSSIALCMMRTMAGFGKRVLLVDADLRASDMERRYRFKFAYKDHLGLAQYLAGMCEMEDVIYQTDLNGAYILPCGRNVLNSMQLLSSPRLGELMRTVESEFDVIIVDTPPASVIVDAVEIAKYCDGALIVVRHNMGSKQEIGEVVASISMTGCKVLGAVMNGVKLGSFSNRRYYYRSGRYSRYYHGYGYGYGYGYNKTAQRMEIKDQTNSNQKAQPQKDEKTP